MSNMILVGDQHNISGDEVIEEKPLSPRKSEKKCPKCGEILKERFTRAFVVKYLLFWLPLKRYKCDLCYHKPYFFGEYSRKRAFI